MALKVQLSHDNADSTITKIERINVINNHTEEGDKFVFDCVLVGHYASEEKNKAVCLDTIKFDSKKVQVAADALFAALYESIDEEKYKGAERI